jgi:hypothetical protein
MAQNKKTKVDFSTALAEQAKKLAPKKQEMDPADEEFLANIGGEDVKFVRGDSTDEEWAAIKAKPAAVQRVTVKPAAGEKSPANIAVATRKKGETDAEWRGRALDYENHPRYDSTVETTEADQRDAKREEYKRLIQNEAYEGGEGALVSKDELKLLRKMDPDAAADFVEERIKKKEIESDLKAKENEVTLPSEKPAPPTIPLKDQMPKPQPPTGGSPGTQTEDDVHLGMGGDMRNPSSFLPQMAMGATGPTGNPMLNAMAERGSEIAAPVVNAVSSVNDAVSPIGAFRKLDNAITGAMRPLNQAFTNPMSPAEKDAEEALAARDPGVDFDPALDTPPEQSALPPQQDPNNPSMGPGNVSASLGVKIPSGFKPRVLDPKFDQNLDASIGAAKKRADDLAELQAANEFVQDGIVRETGKRRLEAEAQMNKEASLAAQANQNALNAAQRYNGARQAALDAAQKAAATPTDPNRYWNNKDDGQKAAAIIAGVFYGFSGNGPQWLQRIDGLIENDQRLQVADRAAKVQGLESQARGYGEAADFAMKAGASEAQAHIIARQMKLESLNSYLQQMTARSQNMQQKVAGQQMLMQLQEKMVGLDAQAKQIGLQEVANENTALYQNASLGQHAAIANAKMSAAGGKARAISPQLASRIANTKEMIAALDNMERLASNKGFVDRMGRNVSEELSSEEAGKLDQYKAQQFILARKRAGSSLQKPEQEALLNLTRPRSGRFDPVPGIREARKAAEQALAIDVQAAQSATAGEVTADMPAGSEDFGFEAAE